MKPNIIVFLSDQQRRDTLGCYGQKLDTTPNLDYMASEGIKFENAFTCQPVCGPARSCIQSGKYATQTKCFVNDIGLREDEKTIAKILSEHGYETAYVGKWHLASNMNVCDYSKEAVPKEKRGGYNDYWRASDILEFTSHGYDGYVFDENMKKIDFEGFRCDKITDFALEFLEKRDKNKPFMLFLSHIEPHHQNDKKTYQGPKGSKQKFGNYDIPKDLENLDGDYKQHYPDYLGCCNSLDENLGRIRKKLKDLNIEKDTVLIYTSDHGCHFKTVNKNLPKGGADDYKRSFYDNTVGVPMIIYGPKFKGGMVVDELVSLIDIPKTVVHLATENIDSDMEGLSLIDVIQKDRQRNEIFIQISESYVGRAIRTKKYKYCIIDKNKDPYKDMDSDNYMEYYLYDLENDPFEKYNKIDDENYNDVKISLRKIIKEYIKNIENIDIKINTKK